MYLYYRTKRKIIIIVSILLLVIAGGVIFYFVKYGKDNNPPAAQKEVLSYTIMYSNGEDVHTLTVKTGELWYIQEIPTKSGYTFKGYFDAEEGGTQYTTADGVCLSAFYETEHLVLYPQFEKTP